MMRIGIVGAGKIGATVGKLWAEAGHDVRLSSRHREELQPLVAALRGRGSAGTPAEAAAFGDVVMLAVPLKAIPDLVRDLGGVLAGKVVLDTSNAFEHRDGDVAQIASRDPRGSAGWAAAMFPSSRWVKAFNTVYFKTLETEARRNADRVGIPIAGDDPTALEVAAQLVQDAGFEPVVVGSLARGVEFEPNTPVYNTGMTGPELRKKLSA
jgi:predicted dinucleotide-binding enzyme